MWTRISRNMLLALIPIAMLQQHSHRLLRDVYTIRARARCQGLVRIPFCRGDSGGCGTLGFGNLGFVTNKIRRLPFEGVGQLLEQEALGFTGHKIRAKLFGEVTCYDRCSNHARGLAGAQEKFSSVRKIMPLCMQLVAHHCRLSSMGSRFCLPGISVTKYAHSMFFNGLLSTCFQIGRGRWKKLHNVLQVHFCASDVETDACTGI